MITVAGELPRSITLPEIQEDKVLYLMFTGIENEYDPARYLNEIVYVITDRALEDVEYLYKFGIYNILPGIKYADLTAELITGFLESSYEVNKGVVTSKMLRIHYSKLKPTYDALMTILLSLRNRQVNDFYDAVKYNLGPVIEKLEDIRRLLEYADNVDGMQQRFAELDAQIEELRHQVGVSNDEALAVAAQEISKLQEALQNDAQRIGLLEDDKAELIKTVNELKTITSDSVGRAQFESLMADKQLVDQQLAAIQIETSNLRAKLKAIEDMPRANLATNEFGKDSLIESLQRELELAKQVTYAERIHGMLPVLTNTVMLRAQHVLQFKEIKPAIYLDSLVLWTQLLLKSAYIKERNLQPIIIIFDTLMDQFRLSKYMKHGFCINKAPEGAQFVVVTNDCNLMFLKNVVEVQRYDFVIIIDRLGSAKCVADSDKTVTYYLTDSPNDITDYKLPADSCIMFNIDTADGAAYHIPPDGAVASIRGDKRWSRIGQLPMMDRILKGLNVIEVDR